MRSRLPARSDRLSLAGFCLASTACTAFQNAVDTWLYLLPVTVDGRGTAFLNTSASAAKNGLAARMSLSLYRLGSVGWKPATIARRFCSAADGRYSTRSAASAGCLENFDTERSQPPRVAAGCAPSPSPLGSAATPTLSLTRLLGSCAVAHAYGQLRMNTALPLWNAARASSSSKLSTPTGEIEPGQ